MKIVVVVIMLCAGFLTSFLNKKKRVLIIGDSISIGYFPFVKDALKDKADIIHNLGNAENTTTGLNNIQKWLGNEKWDLIQFNWGIWDLCRRSDTSRLYGKRDKVNGVPDNAPDAYERQLEELVVILKQTNARLIFVTTTVVPDEEPGRVPEDAERYNAIAKKIMKKYGVAVTDLYKPSKAIHQQYGSGNDNVHYSNEGYEKLAAYVISGLKKYL